MKARKHENMKTAKILKFRVFVIFFILSEKAKISFLGAL